MPSQKPTSRSACQVARPVSVTSFEVPLTRARFANHTLPTEFEESNIRGAIGDDSEQTYELPSTAPRKGQTNYGALDFDPTCKAQPSTHSRKFAQDLLKFTANYSHSYRFSATNGEPNQAFRSEIEGTAPRLRELIRWQRPKQEKLKKGEPKQNQPLQQSFEAVRKENTEQDELFAADMLLMLKNSEAANSTLHRAIKAKQPQIPKPIPTTPQQENQEEGYSCGRCERIDDDRREGMSLLLKTFEVKEAEEAKEPEKITPMVKNDFSASSPRSPQPVRIKPVGSTLVYQEIARRARENLSKSQVTTPQLQEQRIYQLKTPPYSSPSPVSATETSRTPLIVQRPSKRCASEDAEQTNLPKRVRLPTLKAKEARNETVITPPLSSPVSYSSNRSSTPVSTIRQNGLKRASPKKPRDPQAGPSASTVKERLRGERIKSLGFENPNGPCKYCADKGKACYILPNDLASRSDLMEKLQRMGIQLKDVVGKDKKGGFRCHDCTMSKRAGKVCNAGNPEERKTAFTKKN